MASSIFININELNSIIDKLKKIESKLNTVVNSQKGLSKDLESCWSGTSGSKVTSRIKEHDKSLDSYLISIKNEISFLEKTKEAYIAQTNATSKMINENAKL